MSYYPANTTELSGWASHFSNVTLGKEPWEVDSGWQSDNKPAWSSDPASPYAVYNGDVVRVDLNLDSSYSGYSDNQKADLRNRLAQAGLQPLSLNVSITPVYVPSGIFPIHLYDYGGSISAAVQIQDGGHANVEDVGSLVAGIAQAAGYNVNNYTAVITDRNAGTITGNSWETYDNSPGVLDTISTYVRDAIGGAAGAAGNAAGGAASELAKRAAQTALLYAVLGITGVVVFIKFAKD